MDKSLEEHFTENIFTGHKDTDRLVLLNLNGKDLLSFCSSSPYLNSLCNEELFRNRIKNTALEKIKGNYPHLKYRNFYAVMMYYIALLEENYHIKYDFGSGAQPNNATTGDPKVQYQLLKNHIILDSFGKNNLLLESCRKGELAIVK